MAATLALDKFELMWLLEGAAGRSHLSWDVYQMFVDKVYPQLCAEEREFLYTYIKRDTSYLWVDKKFLDVTPYNYWLQMLARFNPANQYEVTLKRRREKSVKHEAYLWNGRYYIDWTRYCASEYIRRVSQLPYQRCDNDLCAVHDICIRHTTHEVSDSLCRHRYSCNGCAWVITDEGVTDPVAEIPIPKNEVKE